MCNRSQTRRENKTKRKTPKPDFELLKRKSSFKEFIVRRKRTNKWTKERDLMDWKGNENLEKKSS